MLERLFHSKRKGFYVDVGAWDPDRYSVTRHFYQRGWCGLNIEPIAWRHALFAERRPRDINVHGLVGDSADPERFFECVAEDYLSTTVPEVADKMRRDGHVLKEYEVQVDRLDALIDRHCPKVIDFLKLDVEGAEAQVLKTIDLRRHRPRALVIEATLPGSGLRSWDEPEANGSWGEWEGGVLEAGYVFALFDGLNRFYVRREDRRLAGRLVLPPGVYDGIDGSQGPQHEAAERLEVIERQQVELETLRREHDAAMVGLGDVGSAAHDALVTRNRELVAKLAEIEADRALRLADTEHLSVQLVETRTALESLSASAARQVAALETDRVERGEVIAGLEAQLETLGSELRRRLDAIARLTGALDESRTAHAALAAANEVRLAELDADRIARGEVIAGLEVQLDALAGQGSARLETIDRLTAELAEAREALTDLAAADRSQIDALAADRAARGEVIEGLQDQLARLEGEGAARLDAIERLTADLSGVREKLVELSETKQAEIEALQTDRAARGEVIDGLKDQLAAIGRESDLRRSTIDQLTTELNEARDGRADLVDATRIQVAALQADRSARGEVIAGLQDQLARVEQEAAVRLDAIERLSVEIGDARQSLVELADRKHAEIDSLEIDRAARGDVIAGLQEQLAALAREGAERLEAIDRLTAQVDAGHERYGALATVSQARIDALEADRTARGAVIEGLQGQLREVGRAASERLEAIERLTAQFEEANERYVNLAAGAAAREATLEADRAARGEVIVGLQNQLAISTEESAARLDAIERLSAESAAGTVRFEAFRMASDARTEALEADRSARGAVIEALEEQLAVLHGQSAERLDVVQRLAAELGGARLQEAAAERAHALQIAALEADRQARGDVIQDMQAQLESLGESWTERGNVIEKLDLGLRSSGRETERLEQLAAERLDAIAAHEARRKAIAADLAAARSEIDLLKRRWATRLKTYITGNP